MRRLAAIGLLLAVGVRGAIAGSSSPIAVTATGDAVWVVNPDSDSVARLDPTSGALVGPEIAVAAAPRTVALTSAAAFIASQRGDALTKLGLDGSPALPPKDLGTGCAPYGVVADDAGDELYVTCQGAGTLVVLGAADLSVRKTIAMPWPEPRALATGPGGKVYVTHFVTKEPNNDGHVSEVDPAAGTVPRVFAIAPDFATCETTGSGQGVANLLAAIAVAPAGAPAGVANQVWVGGTLHNVLKKGLFERSRYFATQQGRELFPALDFQSIPNGEGDFARRNIYKAGFRDIARAGIWKIDLADGGGRGRLDVAHGGMISGLAFAASGQVAYATDQMANGFYVFSTLRGANGNPASLFGPVAQKGPGGVSPSGGCGFDANDVTAEDPYLLAPQARLVPTGGMNPLQASDLTPATTGLEWTLATNAMRPVPDGVGTTPIGLAVAPDGGRAFVAAYLSRRVTAVGLQQLRCQNAPATPCTTRTDCGGAECMPLVASVTETTAHDPLPPEILDGKILFSTAARAAADATPVPPWNVLAHDGSTHQGDVTNTGRGGGFMACTTCHPDFGGNDGRTWDFSQFGSSLRNTMDLRGRAGFAPGTCEHDHTVACTTDATCRLATPDHMTPSRCLENDLLVPPNVTNPADRAVFFNPMGSTHWNGDRDEVEDFEFTFRELLGASDCDGNEHSPETCVGALAIRKYAVPAKDIVADLSPKPNRGVSVRLNHLADYVYSLTKFVNDPNVAGDPAAIERGRKLFNDPNVKCGSVCHVGTLNTQLGGEQQFTDKKPNAGYDPGQPPRADLNSPFFTHDVGTANVFDRANPLLIASDSVDPKRGFTLFQNEQNQIPGNRDALRIYLTPVLNDVWNTAPYLHDGSAATLLDVVRPCQQRFGACEVFATKGRNVDDLHGTTSFMSARQLNDLVAFQKAPRGPLTEAVAIHGTALTVKRLRLQFGKKAGKDKAALVASASLGSDQVLDPTSEGVDLTIGVPAGDTMTYVEWNVPGSALKAKKTTWKATKRAGVNGLKKLVLSVKGTNLAVSLAATTDLGVLRGTKADLTIAVEVGDDVAGVTRPAKANKRGTLVKVP